MTDKETKKSGNNGAGADGQSQAGSEQAKGIKSRLTDAQKEMLASKSRGGTASQSVGHSHKPTHVSGKQGPAEKKVRW
ncbi:MULTISPECIES: hypothetical protein [unclassified Arthrobacter]|uniref:hypothetical protein n=1 Tax=unclassified Arthrobacter TaxID=235627 RepID=UPI002E0B2E95|nr:MULTISPECIES: hypothetical protein [unclassified Arthrobacter]MEC5191252.1 hypothetical protein [Arthrobacter sp. MP_M4]MEC5202509.1 hypothetical protein [Arthrobacter sp. MP_M7]